LIPLYGHPNRLVRCKAAQATLAVSPVEAREVLKSLATQPPTDEAAINAKFTLWNMDRRVFTPT